MFMHMRGHGINKPHAPDENPSCTRRPVARGKRHH
jgi:hypothetical protein